MGVCTTNHLLLFKFGVMWIAIEVIGWPDYNVVVRILLFKRLVALVCVVMDNGALRLLPLLVVISGHVLLKGALLVHRA
jgi:hypothetical protein